MLPASDLWFARTSVATSAEKLLFCFPHGGGGASAYRGWQSVLGSEVGVVPASLPGRESRSKEELPRSITGLSGDLVDPLLDFADKREVFLFGHSMGALIAYELAGALADKGCPPSGLIVSGAVAPHRPDLVGQIHQLPDDQFLAHVIALEGTPMGVLEESGLLDVLLPVLRADFEACETYARRERPPLGIRMLAIGGDDDPRAPLDEIVRWGELTCGEFDMKILPGGHFYLSQDLKRFLAELRPFILGGGSKRG
ncbi:thioesterase II family protein [Streptomyces sp. NPDC003328]